MQQARSQFPSSSLGYWRGATGLSGPASAGSVSMAQGTTALSQGTGAISIGNTEWHPSILYLFALVIGEMVVFHVIGKVLK